MRGFIAKLSNGQEIKAYTIYSDLFDFIRDGNLTSKRPWQILKSYIINNNLSIESLCLEYDHQGIFLPKRAKAYFFSEKVEGYLGGPNSQKHYIGVGASEDSPEEVSITWFDGHDSQIEKRKVDKDSDQFIINEAY